MAGGLRRHRRYPSQAVSPNRGQGNGGSEVTKAEREKEQEVKRWQNAIDGDWLKVPFMLFSPPLDSHLRFHAR